MSAERTCPDDRMVLVQRGGVDDADWAELMAHVRVCDDCRAVWLVARAFDQVGRTEPQDERLVDRAAAAALATVAPMRSRPMFRAAVVVGASLVGAVAMANVGIAIHDRLSKPAPAAEQASRDQPPPHPRHRARSRMVTADSEEPIALMPGDNLGEEVGEPQGDPLPAPTPPAVVPPAVALTAPITTMVPGTATRRHGSPTRELFTRATAARRAGRAVDAIAAFRILERDYPDSPEAMVSLVSLGELLAQGADLDAALVYIDRYLRLEPPGPLAPEALAAKIDLLARLGRSLEAQQSYEELKQHFPDSIYTRRPSNSPR